MRHELASERSMSLFRDLDRRLTGLLPPIETDGRLSPWLSLLVIAALAALSWAILIAIVMALRALL